MELSGPHLVEGGRGPSGVLQCRKERRGRAESDLAMRPQERVGAGGPSLHPLVLSSDVTSHSQGRRSAAGFLLPRPGARTASPSPFQSWEGSREAAAIGTLGRKFHFTPGQLALTNGREPAWRPQLTTRCCRGRLLRPEDLATWSGHAGLGGHGRAQCVAESWLSPTLHLKCTRSSYPPHLELVVRRENQLGDEDDGRDGLWARPPRVSVL